jgi:hypothetical protein
MLFCFYVLGYCKNLGGYNILENNLTSGYIIQTWTQTIGWGRIRNGYIIIGLQIKKLSSEIETKVKAIPVTGPQGCEMSRLPHFLDSWLSDSGEFVSLTD